MKKLFVCTLLLAGLAGTACAQLPSAPKTAALSGVNAGSLLQQFAGGIKPESFAGGWTEGKAGWLETAKKAATAASIVQSVSSLAGFLKPSAFKGGFGLQNIADAANTAKTVGDAAGLLKNLEGGLNPEALTTAWGGQRSGWLKGLDLLK